MVSKGELSEMRKADWPPTPRLAAEQCTAVSSKRTILTSLTSGGENCRVRG